MNRTALTIVVSSLVLALGCDSGEPVEIGRIAVTTDEAAVTFAAASPVARLEAGAALSALADDDGVPVAATLEGMVAVEGDAVVPFEVVAAAGEPDTLGSVHAMARRSGPSSGLLVSSASGLFHTWAGVLLPSPASDALRGATALSVVARDGVEVVYAALPDGLHRLDALTHERLELGLGAPTALAASAEAVLVAFGERLFELSPDDLTYREVPAAIGTVERAVAAGTRLVAGGSAGLALRHPDGRWVVHPALAPVLALATDVDGIAYALVPAGVVRLDDAGPVGLAAVPDETANYVGLALDDAGDVWLGAGTTLTRMDTGAPVGFAADIAPIFALRCAPCHAAGELAPKRDFTDYDVVVALSDAIMTRISTGLMPPPPSPRLDAVEYELLVRWYAGERAP